MNRYINWFPQVSVKPRASGQTVMNSYDWNRGTRKLNIRSARIEDNFENKKCFAVCNSPIPNVNVITAVQVKNINSTLNSMVDRKTTEVLY